MSAAAKSILCNSSLKKLTPCLTLMTGWWCHSRRDAFAVGGHGMNPVSVYSAYSAFGVLRQSLRLGVCLCVWCMVLMIFYCSDSLPGTKHITEDVISGVSLERCPEPGWNNDDGFFVWEWCYHSAELLSLCLCLLWYLLSGWQLGASVSWWHTKYPKGQTDTDAVELNGISPLVKKTEIKRNNS